MYMKQRIIVDPHILGGKPVIFRYPNTSGFGIGKTGTFR